MCVCYLQGIRIAEESNLTLAATDFQVGRGRMDISKTVRGEGRSQLEQVELFEIKSKTNRQLLNCDLVSPEVLS